jgi:hypothetical protein
MGVSINWDRQPDDNLASVRNDSRAGWCGFWSTHDIPPVRKRASPCGHTQGLEGVSVVRSRAREYQFLLVGLFALDADRQGRGSNLDLRSLGYAERHT